MAAIIRDRRAVLSGRGFVMVCHGGVTHHGACRSSIASIYSIRFINTDMKNFKKSLVFPPFYPRLLLISFLSFVEKTPILQKINLLNSPQLNPQPPPLQHYLSSPPRLVNLPFQTPPDTTEAVIPSHHNYRRNLLALLFQLLPPRIVD